ncbi:MAG TPA: hypothetical protein VFX79_02435 [Candidatus Saccharimonadales bacterium]|nr:hypothetical protein [Candidatus Saccharimonadales bacterium]
MSKTKIIILSIVALALLGGGVAAYYYRYVDKDKAETADTTHNDNINYSPPTEQEKKETEEHKKSLAEDKAPTNNPTGNSPSTKKSVTPVIVSYGQASGNVEVSARVPGVIESNGTCKLTLTKGSDSVSQSKKATPNASDTSCGFISIPRSKLSSGSWSAKVSYSSSKAEGVSAAKTIKVQ